MVDLNARQEAAKKYKTRIQALREEKAKLEYMKTGPRSRKIRHNRFVRSEKERLFNEIQRLEAQRETAIKKADPSYKTAEQRYKETLARQLAKNKEFRERAGVKSRGATGKKYAPKLGAPGSGTLDLRAESAAARTYKRTGQRTSYIDPRTQTVKKFDPKDRTPADTALIQKKAKPPTVTLTQSEYEKYREDARTALQNETFLNQAIQQDYRKRINETGTAVLNSPYRRIDRENALFAKQQLFRQKKTFPYSQQGQAEIDRQIIGIDDTINRQNTFNARAGLIPNNIPLIHNATIPEKSTWQKISGGIKDVNQAVATHTTKTKVNDQFIVGDTKFLKDQENAPFKPYLGENRTLKALFGTGGYFDPKGKVSQFFMGLEQGSRDFYREKPVTAAALLAVPYAFRTAGTVAKIGAGSATIQAAKVLPPGITAASITASQYTAKAVPYAIGGLYAYTKVQAVRSASTPRKKGAVIGRTGAEILLFSAGNALTRTIPAPGERYYYTAIKPKIQVLSQPQYASVQNVKLADAAGKLTKELTKTNLKPQRGVNFREVQALNARTAKQYEIFARQTYNQPTIGGSAAGKTYLGQKVLSSYKEPSQIGAQGNKIPKLLNKPKIVKDVDVYAYNNQVPTSLLKGSDTHPYTDQFILNPYTGKPIQTSTGEKILQFKTLVAAKLQGAFRTDKAPFYRTTKDINDLIAFGREASYQNMLSAQGKNALTILEAGQGTAPNVYYSSFARMQQFAGIRASPFRLPIADYSTPIPIMTPSAMGISNTLFSGRIVPTKSFLPSSSSNIIPSPSPSPSLSLSPSVSPSVSPSPSISIPPFEPPPPNAYAFLLPRITKSKRKKERRGTKHKTGYMPTLTAAFLGIEGKESKDIITTGFGLRPLRGAS